MQSSTNKVSKLTALICVTVICLAFGSFGVIMLNNTQEKVKDAKTAVRVESFQDVMNNINISKTCYGVFSISTDSPIFNEQFNIPLSIYGRVTDTYTTTSGSGKHRTAHSHTRVLYEDCVDTLYIDGKQVKGDVFIKGLDRVPLIRREGLHKIYYIENNREYTIGYLSDSDTFVISYDTFTPLTEIAEDPRDITGGIFVIGFATVFLILSWLIILLPNNKKKD